MLEFLVASPFKPKPWNIDEIKLDDFGNRRSIIRKLKAPRPSKWTRQYLEIDRDKIQDSAYRQAIAQYLAGK